MRVPLISAILVAMTLTVPASGQDRLKIAVSPIRSFAPALVRVRVRVDPNADNRMLKIIADSEDYYRESDIPLEGDQSPATVQLELRNLPNGEYEFSSVLIDNVGKTRAIAKAQASVIGVNGPPPPPPPQ